MPSGKAPARIGRSYQFDTIIHVVLFLERGDGNGAALLWIRIYIERVGLVTLTYGVDIPVEVPGHDEATDGVGVGGVITPAYKVETVVRDDGDLYLIAVVKNGAVALDGAATLFKPELLSLH